MVRCDEAKACTQRDKYKFQLEHALNQVECLRSNAHAVESRCRDLDDALAKARSECNDRRAAEEECASLFEHILSLKYTGPQHRLRSELRASVHSA